MEWISVKEQQPQLPDGEWYGRSADILMLAKRNSDGTTRKFAGFYEIDDCGVFDRSYYCVYVPTDKINHHGIALSYTELGNEWNVTHWMPLPEPPKEE